MGHSKEWDGAQEAAHDRGAGEPSGFTSRTSTKASKIPNPAQPKLRAEKQARKKTVRDLLAPNGHAGLATSMAGQRQPTRRIGQGAIEVVFQGQIPHTGQKLNADREGLTLPLTQAGHRCGYEALIRRPLDTLPPRTQSVKKAPMTARDQGHHQSSDYRAGFATTYGKPKSPASPPRDSQMNMKASA